MTTVEYPLVIKPTSAPMILEWDCRLEQFSDCNVKINDHIILGEKPHEATKTDEDHQLLLCFDQNSKTFTLRLMSQKYTITRPVEKKPISLSQKLGLSSSDESSSSDYEK